MLQPGQSRWMWSVQVDIDVDLASGAQSLREIAPASGAELALSLIVRR